MFFFDGDEKKKKKTFNKCRRAALFRSARDARRQRMPLQGQSHDLRRRVPFSKSLFTLPTMFRALAQPRAERKRHERLKRVLGPFDLIAYGVGSTVGTGIFVVYGDVAKNIAGPAVVLSFLGRRLLVAFVCAVLC
jgi:amino acid permease